jgi:hypothetical protein
MRPRRCAKRNWATFRYTKHRSKCQNRVRTSTACEVRAAALFVRFPDYCRIVVIRVVAVVFGGIIIVLVVVGVPAEGSHRP